MMEQMERRYPIGIQTFSEIIKKGLVYVDKTDLMWRAQYLSKFIFLSRPRRFGKSLLSSTFASFFRGEKELFEGLKVMELEQEWVKYPVIHLDLSVTKGVKDVSELQRKLKLRLQRYQEIYGSSPTEMMPGEILAGLIDRAYKKENRQVVVVIDEYDADIVVVEAAERCDRTQELITGVKAIITKQDDLETN